MPSEELREFSRERWRATGARSKAAITASWALVLAAFAVGVGAIATGHPTLFVIAAFVLLTSVLSGATLAALVGRRRR